MLRVYVSSAALVLLIAGCPQGNDHQAYVDAAHNTCTPGDICRPAIDACDVAEMCTSSGSCPTDSFAVGGTACADGDLCNGAETCNGTGSCVAGTALSCDDSMTASADACAAATGCVHLGFVDAAPTTQYGNTTGGTAFPDACPAGQVMVGFNAQLGASFDQVGVICAPIALASGTLAVTTGTAVDQPLRGTNPGTPASSTCPAGTMVVGFAGRAGALIDQLQLRCAAITVTGTPPQASVGTAAAQTAVGGTGGVAFPDTDCAAGAVAVGAEIRAGGSVDAFGLRCGTPTVTTN